MVTNEYWMWGWIALAIIFMIAELFTSGFFLFCFGVGAGVAAIFAYWGLDPFLQIFVFILASGIAVLLTRPIARRLTERAPNFVGSDRVLNRPGVVLTEINPALGSGMVRVDAEEWRAVSEDGSVIPKGTIIRVLRIDGTRLIVRPDPGQTPTKIDAH